MERKPTMQKSDSNVDGRERRTGREVVSEVTGEAAGAISMSREESREAGEREGTECTSAPEEREARRGSAWLDRNPVRVRAPVERVD